MRYGITCTNRACTSKGGETRIRGGNRRNREYQKICPTKKKVCPINISDYLTFIPMVHIFTRNSATNTGKVKYFAMTLGQYTTGFYTTTMTKRTSQEKRYSYTRSRQSRTHQQGSNALSNSTGQRNNRVADKVTEYKQYHLREGMRMQ